MKIVTAGALLLLAVVGCAAFDLDSESENESQDHDYPDLLRRGWSWGSDGDDEESDDDEEPESELRRQYDELEEKMLVVTAAQVEEAVVSAAREHEVDARELAELVYMGTQYGKLDSLHLMMKTHIINNMRILSDSRTAGVADLLKYLAVKANFGGLDAFLDTEYDVRSFQEAASNVVDEQAEFVVILDTMLIRKASARTMEGSRLRTNLLELARQPGVHLFAPLGWGMGINLFTQLDYKDIIDELARALHSENEARNSINDRDERYLRQIYHDDYDSMERDMMEKHAKFIRILAADVHQTVDEWADEAGVTAPKIMLHLEKRMDDDGYKEEVGEGEVEEEDAVFDYIYDRLLPKMPIFDEYRLAVAQVKECATEDEVAEVLDKEGHFLSMNNIAALQRKIRSAMLAGQFEPDIYYFPTPEGKMKSYVMALIAHFMANRNLDPWKIKTVRDAIGAIKNRGPARNTLKVMILDDYAGSGDSLVEITKALKYFLGKDAKNVEIAAAPLLESAAATHQFSSRGLVTFPGSRLDTVLERNELPPRFLGGPGYGEGFYVVTLPYMSPDNQAWFGADALAPLFVFAPSGIKKGWTYPALCTAAEDLDATTEGGGGPRLSSLNDKPVCTAFALQFYCKSMAAARNNPDVDMSRVAAALAEGSWSNVFAHSEKPQEKCVQMSVDALVNVGMLERVRGDVVKQGPKLPAGYCKPLVTPLHATYNDIRRYIYDVAKDAGLFGFEWDGFGNAQ